MIVAIHQPHYMPWLGYLDKMEQADKFIILDDVQLTDRSPMRRNKFIDQSGKETMLSLDLHKKNYREKKTSEIQLNYEDNWNLKHEKFFLYNYNKHKYFNDIWPEVQKVLQTKFDYLLDLEIALIGLIKQYFKINTPIIMQSSLDYNKEAQNSDLMLSLCQCVGADIYLSGRGAKSYMDDDEFKKNNISVVYQNFACPIYNQKNSQNQFIPNLSSLDLLFNYGVDEASKIFRDNMKGFE